MVDTNLVYLELNEAGNIATIWLNRPEKVNALNFEMYEKLASILDEIARDIKIRVVLLRAKGRMFSAGIDVKFLAGGDPNSPPLKPPELFRYFVHTWAHPIFQRMTVLEKPIIAVIHGKCIGGGFELALWADFRFTTGDVDFQMRESKLNMVMDLGGATRLMRLVNPSHAKDILMTGRSINAEEGYRMGIVNAHRNTMEELDQYIDEYIGMLIESGPRAVGLGKRELDMIYGMPEEFALRFEPMFQQECINSKDFKRAMTAFMEKKKPEWKGN